MAFKKGGTGRKEYDSTNRGVAFKNEQKRDGKKDADFAGTLDVDGKQYWLNIWKNSHEEKGVYLKLSVREKKPRGDAEFTPKPAPKASPKPDFDDDLPF